MQTQSKLQDEATPLTLVASSPGTLVIVDMQPGFPLSLSVRRDVEAEILNAIERLWAVVIIEYETEAAGDTHKSLLDLLAAYPHHTLVKKTKEDGSQVVLEALRRLGYPNELIRVCGVMTDICVQQTAAGLATTLTTARIEVVKSACTTWSGRHYDWSSFHRPFGLILV